MMSLNISDKNPENFDLNIKILVLDDEKEIGAFIVEVAKMLNFNCIATTNAKEFMAELNSKISLIIMDLKMPDIDGIEVLRLLKAQNCKSNIVLMSDVDKRVLEIAEEFAKSLGLSVIGRLQKPFRQPELEQILTDAKNSIQVIAKPPLSAKSFIITKEMIELGLDRDEFRIYYQPQVDLATNRLIGVEALIRWQHPEYGLIFPDNFISKAESFAIIDQIDLYVAKNAMADFNKIFIDKNESLTLSLNLSSCSIQNLKFPDTLAVLANKFNINPSSIIIEITESGLIKDLSKALDIFARLRIKNIKISIDDFGTGYAMMEQLRRVPATELKIDKSFIQDMLAHDNARIMTLKIIEMGHELGMSVLAEGVETRQQLEFLRANHCDRIQGYLLSKPLPLSDLLEWIKTSPITTVLRKDSN